VITRFFHGEATSICSLDKITIICTVVEIS
jgi:hypothetical protein